MCVCLLLSMQLIFLHFTGVLSEVVISIKRHIRGFTTKNHLNLAFYLLAALWSCNLKNPNDTYPILRPNKPII